MITLIGDPRGDVTLEQNLSQIFWRSIRIVGKPIDYIPTIIVLLLCIISAFLGEFRFHNLASVDRQAKMLVLWSALGLTAAVTVLGFLIAGFSVFATLSDKELFRQLASYKSKYPISQFKFIFFSFINVFVIYLSFIIISFALTICAEDNSPVRLGLDTIGEHWQAWMRVGLFIVIGGYVSAMLYTLMALRGFIWNLYSSLLIAIFWKTPSDIQP